MSTRDILAWLARDAMRHITPIKMVGLYDHVARYEWFGDVLLATMPGDASHYDRITYPGASLIAFPAVAEGANRPDIAACVARIVQLSRSERVICKALDARLIDALNARIPCEEARALLTFCESSRNRSKPEPARAVRSAPTIDPVARLLLAEHGVYDDDELAAFFNDGSARCHWIEKNHHACAIALTFPTTATIHEIGSVYVRPESRRNGYAKTLVQHALQDLRDRGLIARYVVDEKNAASISLAQACGLEEKFRLCHLRIG